jgi:hypothetical protein
VFTNVETNELKLNLVNRMKKTTTKKNSVPAVAPAFAAAPNTTMATKPVATLTTPVAPVVSVKAAPAKTPIVTAAAPITIEAKIDIGFGNNLYVRGQGAGLSWDRGTPLECVDSQTWRLIVPAKDKLQFKLLLNDTVWAQGEDVVAAPGKKVEVVPAF